ncbi:cation:proton antiporter [Actinokineospora sp.]|uniref:cation:proton antiporter n=1 Tax=Actinokineospora sp. TaxID=1872133 RepID=UPI0040383B4F
MTGPTAAPAPSGQARGLRTWVGFGAGAVALIATVVLWASGATGSDGAKVDPITRFLLVVAVILLISNLLGELMRRLRQPPVLGEILGGLVLGPSVLGLLWPAGAAWLFPADVLTALEKAAQLGLVIFMFLLGCELRTDRIPRVRAVGAVVFGGMGLPFGAGVAVAVLAQPMLAGAGASTTGYTLFFGLALAITALPVLARILVDLGIEGTTIGALALSAAAIGDGVAWLALTAILASTGSGDAGNVAAAVGLAASLVLVTFLVVRHVLAALVARMRSEQLLTTVLVVGAIGFSALTQMINLHPLIGAFLFGAAVPRGTPVVERISRQLQGFTLFILLPLFFAGVGLKTSVGLLGGQADHWLLFIGVLIVAQVTKVIGAGGAARLVGLRPMQAIQVGALMNCRGVTELVIASIGLQYGIINQFGFTILVLVAIVTTAVTGPFMRYLARRDSTLDTDELSTPKRSGENNPAGLASG